MFKFPKLDSLMLTAYSSAKVANLIENCAYKNMLIPQNHNYIALY